MKASDILIVSSNQFIELLALKAEADGMLAENHQRLALGQSMAYSENAFNIIAGRMRALKTEEAKPEQPTTERVTPLSVNCPPVCAKCGRCHHIDAPCEQTA